MRKHESDERAAFQLEVLRRATAAVDQRRSERAADPGDATRRSRLSPLRRTAQIYAPEEVRRNPRRTAPYGPNHSPETLFFA